MFCNNCGKAVGPNLAFCPECGAPMQNMNNNVGSQPMNQPIAQPMNQPIAQPMNQPMAQPMNQPMPQPMNNNGNKSNNKIIILIAVAVILLLLVLIVVVVGGGGKDKAGKGADAATRTILVYLCGSDLEERLGLESYDLAGVDPNEIDLETTNVVVYAGGATK